MSSNNKSAQVQISLDYLEAARTQNLDKLSALLSDDSEYYLLPKSLGGTKKRSNSEYFDLLHDFIPRLKTIKLTVEETIEAPEKVVHYVTSSSETKTGNSYTNEYVFIFSISQIERSGELKITSVKEFIDSKYTSNFLEEEEKRDAPRSKAWF